MDKLTAILICSIWTIIIFMVTLLLKPENYLNIIIIESIWILPMIFLGKFGIAGEKT